MNERTDIEALEHDPEIAALLDFEPVPRKVKAKNGWTPARQRRFIALLAVHGSPGPACEEMGMHRTSARALYKAPGSESFREAWEAATDLALMRQAEAAALAFLPPRTPAPSLDQRRRTPAKAGALDLDGRAPLPGQVMNEQGCWEDEASYLARAEDAKESIAMKLVRCRRAFLAEICGDPAKRAAFEILTELPVDWEIAPLLEPQPFEPWTKTNQRQPDMVLTAEAGWSAGEIGYGPDKWAEIRAAIDAHRAEQGLEPVEWGAD